MKYTITINQRAIVALQLNIDIADAAILDWMMQFSHSPKISKIDHHGQTFYFFSYQKIKDDLPMLNIGKDAIYRRLKKMCEIGLLISHPENQALNRPFYSFSNLMLKIFIESTEPSAQTPNLFGANTAPPTAQTPHDNNINNNNINIDSSESTPEILNNNFKKWTKLEFEKSIRLAKDERKLNDKLPNYSVDLLRSFYAYWSEPDAKGTMKFQKQDTWLTAGRLATWQNREQKRN